MNAEHVVIGIVGYDTPSDLNWIAPLTKLPELTCPVWHVNDAVSAHSGALMGRSGIIVIAGTGSIIVGITEDGTIFSRDRLRAISS
jgi:glucosamine kinase